VNVEDETKGSDSSSWVCVILEIQSSYEEIYLEGKVLLNKNK